MGTIAFCSVIGHATGSISEKEAGRLGDMIGFSFDEGIGPTRRKLSMGKRPVVEGGDDRI